MIKKIKMQQIKKYQIIYTQGLVREINGLFVQQVSIFLKSHMKERDVTLLLSGGREVGSKMVCIKDNPMFCVNI